MKIQPIEIVNDCALIGAGFITIDTNAASRSLFGLFWQKEESEIWIDILFINLKIKISAK